MRFSARLLGLLFAGAGVVVSGCELPNPGPPPGDILVIPDPGQDPTPFSDVPAVLTGTVSPNLDPTDTFTTNSTVSVMDFQCESVVPGTISVQIFDANGDVSGLFACEDLVGQIGYYVDAPVTVVVSVATQVPGIYGYSIQANPS